MYNFHKNYVWKQQIAEEYIVNNLLEKVKMT